MPCPDRTDPDKADLYSPVDRSPGITPEGRTYNSVPKSEPYRQRPCRFHHGKQASENNNSITLLPIFMATLIKFEDQHSLVLLVFT